MMRNKNIYLLLFLIAHNFDQITNASASNCIQNWTAVVVACSNIILYYMFFLHYFI